MRPTCTEHWGAVVCHSASWEPNCQVVHDGDTFKAIKFIAKGEELTHDYDETWGYEKRIEEPAIQGTLHTVVITSLVP